MCLVANALNILFLIEVQAVEIAAGDFYMHKGNIVRRDAGESGVRNGIGRKIPQIPDRFQFTVSNRDAQNGRVRRLVRMNKKGSAVA